MVGYGIQAEKVTPSSQSTAQVKHCMDLGHCLHLLYLEPTHLVSSNTQWFAPTRFNPTFPALVETSITCTYANPEMQEEHVAWVVSRIKELISCTN
jgi:hypothetical protein